MAARRDRLFSLNTRLRRNADLEFVKQHGETAVGRYAVVRAVPAPDGHCRVGIVISRYFSRKAVERNRARRLLRESCRGLFAELRDAWIIIRPRAAIKDVKMPLVAVDLRRLAKRLDILYEASAKGDGNGGSGT